MLRDRQTTWRRLNLLGDLLLTYLALIAIILYYRIQLSGHTVVLLFILTLSVWAVFLYGPSGSYFYRLKSPGQIIRELYLALAQSFLAFTAIIYFLKIPVNDYAVLTFFTINAASLTIFRFGSVAALNYYRTRGRSNRNVVIIGTGTKAKAIADRIQENRHWGIHTLGFLDYHRHELWRYRDIPLLGHPDALGDIIGKNQVDFVIIAVDNGDLPLTRHAFAIGEEMGVTVCFLSDFYFHPISKARPARFLDFPAVVYSSEPDNSLQLVVKGLMDRFGGFMGLLMAIPVGLLAALLIKLEDGGPIFFKQVRTGKHGKPFVMYKFRTMVADAEKLKEKVAHLNEMSGPVFKIKNDPRITRIGSWLRRLSIDELPQLINIVRGEMSLVGPRPPLPIEVSKYDRWQRRKLAVKPGLTCLWQINGRNHVDFEDWMKLDLQYIDNWSIWLDTKILVKTIPTVMKGDGAS